MVRREGSWARDSRGRDYVKESYNNVIKQSRKLKGCEFVCCSYDQLEIPDNAIIYCDPPYKDSLGYGFKFDHDKFWDWVRIKEKEGHNVFISEYKAPTDFECIFEKSILCTIGDNVERIERLFKYIGKK